MRDVNNKPTFKTADDGKVMRIIGISSDSVEKQKEFAKKHDLDYTLLADEKQEARKAFGVSGSALFGLAPRELFLHSTDYQYLAEILWQSE